VKTVWIVDPNATVPRLVTAFPDWGTRVIKELDTVALTCDLPEQGLRRDHLGAVVLVYNDGEAYEVEFVALDGKTIALLTLPADVVRPIRAREIAHGREVA
jgi:hypothetical protein